jgi:hypothetical protein
MTVRTPCFMGRSSLISSTIWLIYLLQRLKYFLSNDWSTTWITGKRKQQQSKNITTQHHARYAVRVPLFIAHAYQVSSNNNINKKNFILPTTKTYKIVGIPGSGTQLLPYTYLQSFVKWTQEKLMIPTDTEISIDKVSRPLQLIEDDSALLLDHTSLPKFRLSKKERIVDERDNFVAKASYDPFGTTTTTTTNPNIHIRPTLHVLMKNSIPSYVMCGIQIRFVHDSNHHHPVQRHEQEEDEDIMNDEPTIVLTLLAQQWMTFSYLSEPNIRMIVYTGLGDGTDERLIMINRTTLLQRIEQLGLLLSDQQQQANHHDASDDENDSRFGSSQAYQSISEGYHLITFTFNEDWMSIPIDQLDGSTRSSHDKNHNDKNEPGVCSDPEQEHPYYVTCILTGETIEARELLGLSPDLIEMTTTSLLQWNVHDVID